MTDLVDMMEGADAPSPDTRPVLIGMNNPLSSEPEHALFPAPEGVTGHNIWRMLSDVCGISRSEYIRAFDRRNVLSQKTWSMREARLESSRLLRDLDGRDVVLFGRDVLGALRLPQTMPLVWQDPRFWLTGGQPRRWCYVPHPSGLNRWYNDEAHRWAAAFRLEQLYEDWRSRNAD